MSRLDTLDFIEIGQFEPAGRSGARERKTQTTQLAIRNKIISVSVCPVSPLEAILPLWVLAALPGLPPLFSLLSSSL